MTDDSDISVGDDNAKIAKISEAKQFEKKPKGTE
jgi:hypothetical protein